MINYICLRQFCIAVFVMMLLVSCKNEKETTKTIIRPVRYQQVISTGGGRVRTFSGVAKAGIESKLSFKVSGTILRIPVKLGDKVKAGQLIAELDPNDYLLQVEEAQASLASANAQARNADADYARIRGLYENNNASRDELDATRAASESANAQVEAAKKRLELARLQLGYTRLVAPVDGAIAEVPVEVNENVSAGQAIVTITSGSRIEVEVAVPEILISQIRKDSPVTVTFDAIPGKHFAAVVTKVGVAATDISTAFPVTVRMDKYDPDILPGMAAEVSFRFENDHRKDRIFVPFVSVGEDRDGHYVFLLKLEEQSEKGKPQLAVARRTPVKVGELTPNGLEILDGLNDGDLIVTAGVRRIKDGLRVKLMDSSGIQQ